MIQIRLWAGALCLLLFCAPAAAQEQERVADRQFIVLSSALVLSSIYDAETTARGLENCHTCREANPIAKPFTDMGRPGIYGFALATDAAMIFVAYRLKQRGSRWWWTPLVAGTVIHGAAGTANLRFVH